MKPNTETPVPNTLGPETPDRGYLPGEPCRYCGRVGGVWFVVDDSPFGICTPQVVACDHCHMSWDVNGRPA